MSIAKIEFDYEMISCLLCEKKFKTKRGLAFHLTRIHDVSDHKQKFSLYIIGDFFPLIEQKSWTKAENLGKAVNSPRLDYCPALTPDGEYLIFTSRRSSMSFTPDSENKLQDLYEQLGSCGNGNDDIYWTKLKNNHITFK